jgi:hypothetical protein
MSKELFNIKKTFATRKTAERNLNLYYKGAIRNRLDCRVIELDGAFSIGHIIPADKIHLVGKNEIIVEVSE